MIHDSKHRGFTLVEMLVYISILTIIFALAITFVFNLIRFYTRYRVERDVSTNAREAMNYMIREAKPAMHVYAPTSVFGSSPGQLSLKTRINPPDGENTTFIDFYIDNGQLLVKREEQDPLPITSDRVEVKDLTFAHFENSNIGELVRINITVGYRKGSTRFEFETEESLTSSVSLRGQY